MYTKMIIFTAVFGHLAFAYPPEYSGYEQHEEVTDHHAHAPSPYHFEYAVNDPHTKDIKSHHEESDGHGNVKGMYSLVEADGSTRVVEYTADHDHGFVAKVKKIEAPHHHDEHDLYEQDPIHSYVPSTSHYNF